MGGHRGQPTLPFWPFSGPRFPVWATEAKRGPQGKGQGSQEPSSGWPKPLSPPCCPARPGGCIPALIYGVQGGPYFPLPRGVGLQVDLPEGGLRPGRPAHTAAQRESPPTTSPRPAAVGRVHPHTCGPGPDGQQVCSLFCHQRLGGRFSPLQSAPGRAEGEIGQMEGQQVSQSLSTWDLRMGPCTEKGLYRCHRRSSHWSRWALTGCHCPSPYKERQTQRRHVKTEAQTR